MPATEGVTVPKKPNLAIGVGVPLAWAAVLLFHGSGPLDDAYGNLHDEATRFVVVHVASVLLIGLMGIALYQVVRDLPGLPARISRLAIGPFVLFYAVGDALQGVATGVLVQHANDVSANQRGAVADAADALYGAFAPELLIGLGTAAGIVAILGAAEAHRRAGAPVGLCALLGLSAIMVLHAPPTGPLGLTFFATAVWLLARRGHVSAGAPSAAAMPAPRATA